MNKMTPMILVMLMLTSVLASIDIVELQEMKEIEDTNARAEADPEVVVITSPRETMFSSDVTGRSGEYLQKPGFFESSIELLVISLDSLSKSYFTTIGFPIVDIVWTIPRSNLSPEYAHSR